MTQFYEKNGQIKREGDTVQVFLKPDEEVSTANGWTALSKVENHAHIVAYNNDLFKVLSDAHDNQAWDAVAKEKLYDANKSDELFGNFDPDGLEVQAELDAIELETAMKKVTGTGPMKSMFLMLHYAEAKQNQKQPNPGSNDEPKIDSDITPTGEDIITYGDRVQKALYDLVKA